MPIHFDPLLLSRIQFAFTISFHIIFPAFTIGLASWLAVLEGFYLKTKHPVYREIYLLWSKVFAVAFAMGVVSGVTMSYEFGTNWSPFSAQIGRVIGPLLAFEVLTAFFLEASFLGIMLFGWNKVSPRMHFFATITVAVGTIISAFWILSANSWLQTPQGFTRDMDGNLIPTNWIKIIFNPSFPYRFTHMLLAAYLTTAFVVGGVSAMYLWKKKHIHHARIMFAMAMFMAVVVTPIQIAVGDAHGLNTLKYQPAKVAAMEGLYKTEKSVPMLLFGWPDDVAEKMNYSFQIPGLASLILKHDRQAEIKGLSEWPKADRPPVGIVFFSFRIMVGLGLLMFATGLIATVLAIRKKLFTSRWFLPLCIALTPAGFIALLAGWFVTEVGRQPYTIYGVMRTAASVSPIAGEEVAFSLLLFVVSYIFIFGAGVYYIVKLLRAGPDSGEWLKTYSPVINKSVLISDVFPKKL